MIANTLPPAQALAVMLGFTALFGLLLLAMKVVSLKLSGWKAITERFPMREVNSTGARYKQQPGVVGKIGSGRRGFFDICFASEGVCIRLASSRQNPCFVPWSAIRRVSVSDSSLFVVVDYERPFEFFLPAEALPTFQANLSPQLFQKAVSPLDAAKAALKDGTQPTWMRAINGAAVKLVEKEIEKEKKRREQ